MVVLFSNAYHGQGGPHLQRDMYSVHRVRGEEVWWSNYCLWWLWWIINKGHSTSKMSQRASWGSCHIHWGYETYHGEGEFSGKQYQQAAVHQHAWQVPGEEMQSVPCSMRCRCAHCTESGGIGHINGHCTGWWGHRSTHFVVLSHQLRFLWYFFDQSPRKIWRIPKCGTSRLSRSN